MNLRQAQLTGFGLGIAVWLVAALYQPAAGQQLEVPADLKKVEQHRIDTIARASRASVCIFGRDGQGGGSGVVISQDGYALTNFHVVQGNGPFMKCGMPDGQLYDSVLVGIDPTGDVALVKLLGRDDFPSAVMGDSDKLKVGQWCFAVGNPFLLATNFKPSISWGIVSGIHRYQYPSGTLLEYTDCIQTDAAINPGNSGGPLFNSEGELVGINGRGSFEKRGRVNVGVGYAISINQIKYFMSHLRSGRIVDHATLGATVAANDAGEVRVSNILESSDAYRKGLRFDDRIVSFADREINTVNQFKNILGIFPMGWRVKLRVERGVQQFEIVVRLSGVHSPQELAEMIQGSADSQNEQPNPDELPGDVPIPTTPRPKPKYDLQNADDESLFEQRRGFANHYFNRAQLERVWNGLLDNGNFGDADQKWRITGLIDNEPATFILGSIQSGIQTRTHTHLLDATQDLRTQLAPGDSAGLLLAMHLWRKMLVDGPQGYGDVIYFGSLPLFVPQTNMANKQGFLRQGSAETLVATVDVVETNFLFDQSNGRLVAMEVYPDVGVDPCELHFLNYQVHDDLAVPSEIRVVSQNQPVSTIKIEQIEFINDDSPGDPK